MSNYKKQSAKQTVLNHSSDIMVAYGKPTRYSKNPFVWRQFASSELTEFVDQRPNICGVKYIILSQDMVYPYQK